MSIQPFEFPETGQQIRVIGNPDAPLFHHADACKILQHTNPSVAIRMLDDDEKQMIDPSDIPAGRGALNNVRAWFITESGLFTLALRSNAAGAKPFRRWVTHEVLPAIRRTGRYEVSPQPPREMTKLEALRAAIESEEGRLAAEARAVEAEQQVRALEPAAHSWEVLASAAGDFALRDAALILNRDPNITTGQNLLAKKLKQLGMTDWRGTPYAKHKAHLTERPQTYTDRESGEERQAKPQVRVTVAGLKYLHRKLGGVEPLRLDQPPLDDVG